MQQARDGDFLLIAAGERARWLLRRARFDLELIDQASGLLLLARQVEPAPAGGARPHARQRRVVGDRQRQRQPFAFAVFAQVAEAATQPRCSRTARCDRLLLDRERARTQRLQTIKRAHQFAAA